MVSREYLGIKKKYFKDELLIHRNIKNIGNGNMKNLLWPLLLRREEYCVCFIYRSLSSSDKSEFNYSVKVPLISFHSYQNKFLLGALVELEQNEIESFIRTLRNKDA